MRAARGCRRQRLIQFRNLTLARGARRLVENSSLQLHPGWRVGVVGANGSGKSSLFALLRGDLQPEAGEVSLPSQWRIASVAQETPALDRAAIDYVLDGDTILRETEHALAEADRAGDGAALAAMHARLEAIDGYAAPARAAVLLAGLGFPATDLARPVRDFSGGWRMRLNLARALASRADLLLLDEPTNHLDLDAVVWLERWLASYPGTLLLVSHDRDVLDACVTHILHIESIRLTPYTGNYSAFEEQRAARLAAQQALHEKQQRQIAHMEAFVARFRAKASKARQVQSRIKALDRLERTEAAHVDAPFEFEILPAPRAPDPLLTLEEAEVGYPGRTVLERVQLSLRPGTRLGLLGANGAGKSTLQHLAAMEPRTRELELRTYLGGFDFRGAMAETPVAVFSGGEKSRLALALLVRRRPNLLLLDEPTNHLDLEMRHALTRALAEYEGSLVVVSHDRTLLRTICDGFLLVDEGRAAPFDGDVDDYLAWLAARRASAGTEAARAGSGDRDKRRALRDSAAAERQARLARRRPLAREADGLERDIAALETEKTALEARLADAGFYAGSSTAQVQAATRRCTEVGRLIERAEERWLEVQEALEAIGPP